MQADCVARDSCFHIFGETLIERRRRTRFSGKAKRLREQPDIGFPGTHDDNGARVVFAPFCPRVFLISLHPSGRWMVGAVGIEPLLWEMKCNAAESRSSEAHLGRGCGLEDSWI